MNEYKDDRDYERGRTGGELSPPLTPEEQERIRQELGLRPLVPVIPTPPKKRKRRVHTR